MKTMECLNQHRKLFNFIGVCYHSEKSLPIYHSCKPSNGLGLRCVNPGLSLGWAGFIGLGSLNSFPGPGRAPSGPAPPNEPNECFTSIFSFWSSTSVRITGGNDSPSTLLTRTTFLDEVRSKANALQMKIVWKKAYDLEKSFWIPCAWRSILSDTIDREIYHRESETFTGATPIGANNEDFKHSSIPVSFYPLSNAKKLEETTENKELLQPF